MAAFLKITSLVLMTSLGQGIFATTASNDAYTLDKCIDTSVKLSTSLNEALKGLAVFTKKPVGEDCLDLLHKGVKKDGVYDITPGGKAMKVYCDMTTDGGGWTVFQRRVNALVDFYLGWDAYKKGFGDLKENFWLGLDNINQLTSFSKYSSSLRVDMWIPEEHRYEKYNLFKVGNELSRYILTVTGASGTAGDSLVNHNGKLFSTKDRDHDTNSKGSCAVATKGAWWYGNCHSANLNGIYHNGNHSTYADGINWNTWKGVQYSLLKVEMKVRRNKKNIS